MKKTKTKSFPNSAAEHIININNLKQFILQTKGNITVADIYQETAWQTAIAIGELEDTNYIMLESAPEHQDVVWIYDPKLFKKRMKATKEEPKAEVKK